MSRLINKIFIFLLLTIILFSGLSYGALQDPFQPLEKEEDNIEIITEEEEVEEEEEEEIEERVTPPRFNLRGYLKLQDREIIIIHFAEEIHILEQDQLLDDYRFKGIQNGQAVFSRKEKEFYLDLEEN